MRRKHCQEARFYIVERYADRIDTSIYYMRLLLPISDGSICLPNSNCGILLRNVEHLVAFSLCLVIIRGRISPKAYYTIVILLSTTVSRLFLMDPGSTGGRRELQT